MGWRDLSDDAQRFTFWVSLASAAVAAVVGGVWYWWGYFWDVPPPIRALQAFAAAVLTFVVWWFVALIGHRYFGYPKRDPFYPDAASKVESSETANSASESAVEPAGVFVNPPRTLRPSEYMGLRKPWEQQSEDIHPLLRQSPAQTAVRTAFLDVNRTLHEVDRLKREAAAELPKGTVRLDWRQTDRGLYLDAVNRTPNAIRDFRLFLCDLRIYVESTRTFAEVEEFHANGSFRELELVGGNLQLFSETPVMFPFLNTDATSLYFQGRTKDASMDSITIRRAGVWQATFRYEAIGKQRTEHLCFWWSPGVQPVSYVFPTPISKAPPQIEPVRG